MHPTTVYILWFSINMTQSLSATLPACTQLQYISSGYQLTRHKVSQPHYLHAPNFSIYPLVFNQHDTKPLSHVTCMHSASVYILWIPINKTQSLSAMLPACTQLQYISSGYQLTRHKVSQPHYLHAPNYSIYPLVTN